MSRLTVYPDDAPGTVLIDTTDGDAIAAALAPIGVTFARWPIAEQPGDDDAALLAAYEAPLAALRTKGGYRAVDVVKLTADVPDAAAMRGKFLAEHRHDEDEVRFFVEGSGLFYLRDGGRVHRLRCEAGDLISVPAGTRHWFDMGPRPHFAAIRLFTNPEGWVARFTGDTIADGFIDDGRVPA